MYVVGHAGMICLATHVPALQDIVADNFVHAGTALREKAAGKLGGSLRMMEEEVIVDRAQGLSTLR